MIHRDTYKIRKGSDILIAEKEIIIPEKTIIIPDYYLKGICCGSDWFVLHNKEVYVYEQ